MIAADSSSLIAYLSGHSGSDIEKMENALFAKLLVLPPPVLTELLSDPEVPAPVLKLIAETPLLPLAQGYWERTGHLRAKILAMGLKAKLADTLIAQCCIDHNVPLITRDPDFRHFSKFGGLKLLL